MIELGWYQGEPVKNILVRNKSGTFTEYFPLKHGQWEKVGYGITERVRCSYCKSTDGAWMRPPFCSQCGAKMDLEE